MTSANTISHTAYGKFSNGISSSWQQPWSYAICHLTKMLSLLTMKFFFSGKLWSTSYSWWKFVIVICLHLGALQVSALFIAWIILGLGSAREISLQCNCVSHWLSPYPEWSPNCDLVRPFSIRFWSTLIEVTACCLFGSKPLPKSVLMYPRSPDTCGISPEQCLKQAVAHSLNSTWLSGEQPQIVCGRLKISMVI